MAVPSRTGTGFTNLSQLIGANKKARVGETFGSGVSGVAGKARTGLAGAESEFKTGLGQEQSKFGEQQGQIQSAFNKLEQDPNQIGENEANQFSTLRGTAYQGPQGFANKDQLIGQGLRAEQTGALTRSAGGREELLKQFVGNKANPYTSGQRKLDAMILGQGPQAQLKQARRETVGLGQQAQNKALSAEEQAKAQTQAIEQFKAQTGQQLSEKSGLVSSDINKQLGELQNQEKTRLADVAWLKGGIAGGNAEAIRRAPDSLGLSPEQKQNLARLVEEGDADTRNILANKFDTGSTPLTRAFAANESQRSKANALARLAGGQQEFTGPVGEKIAAGIRGVDAATMDKLRGGLAGQLNSKYGASNDYNAQTQALQSSIGNLTNRGDIQGIDLNKFATDSLYQNNIINAIKANPIPFIKGAREDSTGGRGNTIRDQVLLPGLEEIKRKSEEQQRAQLNANTRKSKEEEINRILAGLGNGR